jgi:predicted DNA-binding ribbon-helix-helix protein
MVKPHRPADLPRKRSLVVKRSVTIAGRTTSVTLEDGFWNALKEIAIFNNTSLPGLVRMIDKERQHSNLSSAIRLFVLDYYRGRV